MGKIYYIMGKSASGKDTIYSQLLKNPSCALQPVVLYTTRPMRDGESQGIQYHFVTVEEMEELAASGRVIEQRAYQTVHGIWYYFTVDDEELFLEEKNYLMLGTLESYIRIRDYYGKDRVCPIYIQVEDGLRLLRAISREQQQEIPQYEEMCRRFLADQKDFSEENIQKAGIERRFRNEGELESCLLEIQAFLTAGES